MRLFAEYKLMFGWTRVPLPDMDTVVNPGGFPSTSHHIIVLFRDQAYVVDVYNVQTGGRLTVADVERQLWAVVNDAMNTPRQPSVCILTSEHRDNWAAARAYMVKHDAVNKNNFGLIESALFVLCLDDRSLPDQLDVTFRMSEDVRAGCVHVSSCQEQHCLAENMAHSFDGHNRWFDKTISVICMSNGKAGMNGEVGEELRLYATPSTYLLFDPALAV